MSGFTASRALSPLLTGLLLLGATTITQAAPGDDAQAVIETTAEQIICAMHNAREKADSDPANLRGQVEAILVPHFDAIAMSRLALGDHWNSASKEQKIAFAKQFRRLLARSYSTALASYEGEIIEYQSGKVAAGGKEATVRTEIFPKNGPSIPIHYTMSLYDGNWRVVDVRIAGASLIINHSDNFTAQIQQGGLDHVIQQLRQHNAVEGA